jgi:5'/3'-nucleotidase SurE
LTNDDGISAPGLQAARKALREIEGVEVDVIAPDSNRSATARSITTRSPLTVEEVEFGDGDKGYATDGTPVDCVRFAELGLVGHRPDLIFSGINHGANLGDDITYSGTVAAALGSCSASRPLPSRSSPPAAAWVTSAAASTSAPSPALPLSWCDTCSTNRCRRRR